MAKTFTVTNIYYTVYFINLLILSPSLVKESVVLGLPIP